MINTVLFCIEWLREKKEKKKKKKREMWIAQVVTLSGIKSNVWSPHNILNSEETYFS